MTRGGRFAVGGALGVLALAGVATVALRLRGPSAGERLGRTLGEGVVRAAAASARVTAPRPCARLARAAHDLPARALGAGVELRGDELRVAADGDAVIGFVADARADTPATRVQLAAIRARFAAAEVGLVVSLGGMGGDRAALDAALGALARGAPWPLLAVPGDREPIAAHRAAIEALAGGGAAVVDGSAVRFASIGGVVLATLPGAAGAARLGDRDGCTHDARDLDELAAALGARAGVRILAGHAAPRGPGAASSDVARGGVHIGDPALARAAAAAKATLVVHGLVDEAAGGARGGEVPVASVAAAEARNGAAGAAGAPLALGTGAAEAAPLEPLRGPATVTGGALIVRVAKDRVRWERIVLEGGGAAPASAPAP